MSIPYVYLVTSKSNTAAISRRIPTTLGSWARVSFDGCGDGSRSLEVWCDPRGIWSVNSRPGPAHAGETRNLVHGCLGNPDFADGAETLSVRSAPDFAHNPQLTSTNTLVQTMRACADELARRNNSGELNVGSSFMRKEALASIDGGISYLEHRSGLAS